MKCNNKSHKGFGFVIFMLYYYDDTLHINSLQDLIVRYWRYQYVISSSVNPLLPEFFYRRFSGQRKIGSFCLPTHSHDAHRNFFMISSCLRIEILALRALLFALGSKVLILSSQKSVTNEGNFIFNG